MGIRPRKKVFKKTPWVQLINGSAFDLEDFEHDLKGTTATDVIRQMSHLCRFNGACAHHYSVAQHSVLVADIIAEAGGNGHMQMQGLLHDVHEIIVGDITTPLKRHFGLEFTAAYDRLTAEADDRLFPLFGVVPDRSEETLEVVRIADQVALARERYALCSLRYGWGLPRLRATLYQPIEQLTPELAETLMYRRWRNTQDLIKEDKSGPIIKDRSLRRAIARGDTDAGSVLRQLRMQ